MQTTVKTLLGIAAVAAFGVACSESSPTAPTSGPAVASASFGKNPSAGGGTGGGGGGGGGVANCGQPLVTLSHGAQFSQACSQLLGCGYIPVNAAARALAPKGLDINCNIRV